MKKNQFAPFPLFSLLLIVSSLSVVVIAAWIYFQKLAPTADRFTRLKNALELVTQRAVSTDGYSLEIQTTDIQELAVVERTFQSIIKYETRFLGVKKTLILRAQFRAKAGFDLSEASPFSLDAGRISGDLGPARILSVEMLEDSLELFHTQDAALNKLQPGDHTRATQLLLAQARTDAEQGSLRREAEERVRERLRDLSGSSLPDPL